MERLSRREIDGGKAVQGEGSLARNGWGGKLGGKARSLLGPRLGGAGCHAEEFRLQPGREEEKWSLR